MFNYSKARVSPLFDAVATQLSSQSQKIRFPMKTMQKLHKEKRKKKILGQEKKK